MVDIAESYLNWRELSTRADKIFQTSYSGNCLLHGQIDIDFVIYDGQSNSEQTACKEKTCSVYLNNRLVDWFDL